MIVTSFVFRGIAQITYPDDIRWLDMKKDFNAKGDGITDDTEPIRRAFAKSPQDYGRPKLIYFPAGTYIVKQALISDRCCLSIRGQGPEQSIIKLADNAYGYDNPDDPKSVIETGPPGNSAHRNNIWDIGINTGKGNSGATGITYLANNKGSLRNVTISSGDGEGVAGLDLTKPWPGPCLISNLEVNGFRYGIDIAHSEFGIPFEHITLKNQKIAAIRNIDNIIAVRDIYSSNSVPALICKSGMAILIDAVFENGASSNPAIRLTRMVDFKQTGRLYARNVTSKGYRYSVEINNSDQKAFESDLSLTEYISHESHTLFDSPHKSLGLPVEETPVYHPNDLSKWENVEDHGAYPDDWENDAPGIQAALNSGKPLVYLPRGFFIINNTLSVPGTVRKIMGFDTHLRVYDSEVTVFHINQAGSEPCIIEMIQEDESHEGTVWVKHESSRPVVLKSCAIHSYQSSSGAGKLFLEDIVIGALAFTHSQSIWARQLNIETDASSPKITNSGATLWLLGMKTERKGTVIKTINNGQTEFLGTLLYPAEDFGNASLEPPAFINNNSSVSAIYALSAYSDKGNYPIHIKEIRNGATKTIRKEDLPSRSDHGSLMGLYAGFELTNDVIHSTPKINTGNKQNPSFSVQRIIPSFDGKISLSPDAGEFFIYSLQGRLIGKYIRNKHYSGTTVKLPDLNSADRILFVRTKERAQ
ncbi:MAG: hypothetical protein GF401_09670 [Chitinivibrionales bacterium]|nr:hypothetical protein [Chitinivibrionales bacterium]